MEEAAGERRLAEGADCTAAGALAEDHHVVRVTAELLDILLDPLEGLDHVEDTIVSGDTVGAFSGEKRMGHEAVDAETVVDGDEDDVLACPLLGVKLGLGTETFAVAAAMDPEGDRKLGAGVARLLGPDIHIEAVLAEGSLVAISPLSVVATLVLDVLVAGVAEALGEIHAVPRNYRLGSFPAVLPDRRCGIRDTAEYEHVLDIVSQDALNLAAFDGEDGAQLLLGPAAGQQGQHSGKQQ